MDENFSVDAVAADQLKAFIERIESAEADMDVVKDVRKSIYDEAKGNGFDTKAIRQLIALRKKDYAERQEEEAILDLYRNALGV